MHNLQNYRFRITLVGRPNVGKSTLFNRLVGKRVALSSCEARTTRDYLTHYDSNIGAIITDTAGLESTTPAGLPTFDTQTYDAIAFADLLLFLVDGKSGLTFEDQAILAKVRKKARKGSKTILVINKTDCKATELHINSFYPLGLGEGICISAEHNIGVNALAHSIEQVKQSSQLTTKALQQTDALPCRYDNNLEESDNAASAPSPAPYKIDLNNIVEDEYSEQNPLRLIIIGQPNAGKSSLTNRLLGYNRVAVSSIPGSTRESISTVLDFHGQDIILIDSAGIRRRGTKTGLSLESLSFYSMKNALGEADIAILLIDGETGRINSQDLRIANLAIAKGKALIIAANKWDVTISKSETMERLQGIAKSIFLNCSVIPISARTGLNCDLVMQTALDLHKLYSKKIKTSVLNNWLTQTVERFPPPMSKSKKRIKIKYITQRNCSPPQFLITLNTVDNDLGQSYTRYIVNRLREDFGLHGVPIAIKVATSKNVFLRSRESA